MAKSKSKKTDPTPPDYSSLFVAGKSAAPMESYGIPGKSYAVPPKATKTLNIPKSKTPVVTDLGSSLRGMQGQNRFDPSIKNTVRAVSAATALNAVSTFKVVRGVASVAKNLQRDLAAEMKWDSNKGLSNLGRQAHGEYKAELLPSEQSSLKQFDLRAQISEAMKTVKGPIKIKRR